MIRKALIPAAGLGTRFLPATKTVPKEMLPIIDRPSLLYIVEEALDAGIEDIIIVAGRGKTAIEDFFDRSYELEDTLERTGKTDLLNIVKKIRDLANIVSIRQKFAMGLGHAVLSGKPAIGNEPFVVLLGDEIMIGKPNVTEQLAKSYQETGLSSVAIMEVPEKEVVKYGIVKVSPQAAGTYKIHDVVEKPAVDKAPSRFALPGRYAFHPKIFSYLQNTKPGKNGEIQLTDGMTELAKNEGLLGVTFSARRFDTGDKLGFFQANVEMALEHPEIGAQARTYLKDLARRL
ncbi:MAG TPA: UTP--glucose-1-phosphate uridylyltransferase GalU [Bdellovibrionales bacterium]|nr:UTP--glucose-1-phosphate uridylyltransferase GalU [Bdellovibrionales bacterium]